MSDSFFSRLAKVINSGQSRSLLLCGNVHDLFFVEKAEKAGRIAHDSEPSGESVATGEYVPLVHYLSERCAVDGLSLLVYELNGPIRVVREEQRSRLREAWVAWRSGTEPDQLALRALSDKSLEQDKNRFGKEFDTHFIEAIGRPTMALEFLRQLTICSRSRTPSGKPYLRDNLLIFIEAADLLIPAGDGDVARLSQADRRRVGIVQDWFSDPGFTSAEDTIVLLADSASLVHPRVARLPQTVLIDVPAPDQDARKGYIENFFETRKAKGEPVPDLWGSVDDLARFTAGLSIHALRHLLVGAAYGGDRLEPADVFDRVEEFIRKQLGDDVVEFKKPKHTLDDVVGFANLKGFIEAELLPRFKSSGPDALPGAAVSGPIGGGKTFIFEAVAGALDLPVLVLKNIRSQWFGQTDVLFERLKRVLEALVKVVIFVDEADTQFGGVGADAHATERRLTGKIQQMMSDPKLRGRIIWLLMTARIHLLSPDIRRPGRVGDLIIPILDPEGEDRKDFLRWVLGGVMADEASDEAIAKLDGLTEGYSAAAFASLRSQLKAKALAGPLDVAGVEAILRDHIPPAIAETRRYQTLQALINCTRRSLLPDAEAEPGDRSAWAAEIRALEAQGIR